MARSDAPSMPKEERIGGRLKWEVENDLRALRDADQIKKDSKRLNSVKKLAKREMGVLSNLVEHKSCSFKE